MKKILSVIAILFFLNSVDCVSQEISQQSGAYDFRGIKLGITLDEFKDQARSIMPKPFYDSFRKKTINSNIQCINQSPEIISCSFWSDSGRKDGVTLGDTVSTSYGFEFSKQLSGEKYVLYKIWIWPKSWAYESIYAGLLQKFGKPKLIKSENLQSMGGAVFKNTISTWKNKYSKISLEKYYSDIENGSLEYSLSDYEDFIESKKLKEKIKSSFGM